MTARHDYLTAFLTALLLHAVLLTALGGRLPGQRQAAPAPAIAHGAPLAVNLVPALRVAAAVSATAPAPAVPAVPAVPAESRNPSANPATAEGAAPQAGDVRRPFEAIPAAAVGRAFGLPAREYSKPRLTGVLDPVFPLGARLRGEEGDVRVKVLLAASGRLSAVELLESSGSAALDRSAVRAVKQARFAPALAGGRPVDGELVIRIRFRLEES